MKMLITLFALAAVSASLAQGPEVRKRDTAGVVAAANAARSQGDIPALTALAGEPDLTPHQRALVLGRRAHTHRTQGDRVAAVADLDSVRRLYRDHVGEVSPSTYMNASHVLAVEVAWGGDWAQALSLCDEALVETRELAPARTLNLRTFRVGLVARVHGDAQARPEFVQVLEEAQTQLNTPISDYWLKRLEIGSRHPQALVAYLLNNAHDTVPDDTHVVWRVFEALNFDVLGVDATTDLLQRLLLKYRATESNVPFLSMIRSELGKFQ